MRFVIDHLSKHFEKKEVLKEITFTFEEGKIYGLLGRNGAGKTTLFNCLNRDIRADGGTFFWMKTVRPEKSPPKTSAMCSPPRRYLNFLPGASF